MSDEWGEWQIHDGKGCPCVGKMVEVIMLQAEYIGHPALYSVISTKELPPETVIAGAKGGRSWDDRNYPKWNRILRYRIRKPRALIQLIDMVEKLPTPTERVQA